MMWATAGGLAVVGGTAAVTVADNHGVMPKPLSQHQVTNQLAAVQALLSRTKPQPVPRGNLSGGAKTTVVTTAGGSEALSCSSNFVTKLNSISPADGWTMTADVPERGTRLITRFHQTSGTGASIRVVADCQGGTPKWTVTRTPN